MTECAYKTPDILKPHNRHLRTHTYMQGSSILTTCVYFIEHSGNWNLYVPMTTCFIITRYSNIRGVPSLLTVNTNTPFSIYYSTLKTFINIFTHTM